MTRVFLLCFRGILRQGPPKNYFWGPVAKAMRAGFVEKQIQLRPGLLVNYAEGPGGGIPLLLIHGQGMTWQDYGPALPALTSTFHVIAADCHGHGKLTWNPKDYNANTMADDLASLGRTLFDVERFVASGHSSGGHIVALIAAQNPDAVQFLVIEDAPFFSTEPERAPKTYAYIDSFDLVD